ncbi:hypothetical protein [Streptacidiphilus rugosus]|uniref:hypothetical protein n=1 Tax=Streptacidiphilus rugosus TaxID=405783 RepID=UPI0012FBD3A4|nr:hypothetical protein [Streptacidiphilus rugosus]
MQDEQYVRPARRYSPSIPSGYLAPNKDLPYGPIPWRRLWAACAATAVVVVLSAPIAILFVHGVLHIPAFDGKQAASAHITATSLALWSGLATIAAAAVLTVLLRAVPRPLLFFDAIATLVAVLIALLPFASRSPENVQIASSLIYLLLGLEIMLLLSGAAQAILTQVMRIKVIPPTVVSN